MVKHTKPEIIYVLPVMNEETLDKKEGQFFPESHYKQIIKHDCDVYTKQSEDDPHPKLLLKFRKNVIPDEICKKAFHALKTHAQHKNYNRGAASGVLNLAKMPAYVGKVTKKDKFRIYYKSRNGKKTKDNISNMAMSNIAGYYDKPDRNNYSSNHDKKTKKNNNHINAATDSLGNPMCRTTQFTKDEVEKWNETVPLIQSADKMFKRLIPDRHRIQLTRARKTPKFIIADTAYSTITVNYNWRTALHKDKGDLDEGFGNLIVLEEKGSCDGDEKVSGEKVCDYKGGFLGFPQWGVAVDVRQGDFLAMDVHQYHCNTPITGVEKGGKYGRLSVVCYLRKNMIKCAGGKEHRN